MENAPKQTAKEIATIGAGALIAKTGTDVALNMLPPAQEAAKLGVINTTRASLGVLSSAIAPLATLGVMAAGIKLMTKPLFEPWTSTAQSRKVG